MITGALVVHRRPRRPQLSAVAGNPPSRGRNLADVTAPSEPCTRQALLAAGRSAARLNQDLRAGRSVAIYRGVHVDGALAAQFRVRAAAAMLTQSAAAVVSHRSAAVVLGMRWLPQAWAEPSAPLELIVPAADAHRHRSGLRLHRRTLTQDDVVRRDRLTCTSPARTLVELARETQLRPLLVVQIIDGAYRDRLCLPEDLTAVLARMPGERNVARARKLVARARVGVDSPRETELRMVLEDGGVAGIRVGPEISDDDGTLIARGDLGDLRLLLWGEYDGYESHSKRETFRKDRVGDRWLRRRGWHVLRFVDEDLTRPHRIVEEWRAAAAEAPARIAALRPGCSPELDAARRLLGLDR